MSFPRRYIMYFFNKEREQISVSGGKGDSDLFPSLRGLLKRTGFCSHFHISNPRSIPDVPITPLGFYCNFIISWMADWNHVRTTCPLYTSTRVVLVKHKYDFVLCSLKTCPWVLIVQIVNGSLRILYFPAYLFPFFSSPCTEAAVLSISIICELVRNADSWAHFRPVQSEALEWGPAICALTNSPLLKVEDYSPKQSRNGLDTLSGNSYSSFGSQLCHHLFHEAFSAFTWQRLPCPPQCPHDMSAVWS